MQLIPGAMHQIQQNLAMMLADPNGPAVTAILHWRTAAALPDDYDPNDESTLADAGTTDHSLEFRALFHIVETRLSGFQRHMEISTGDVLLDYLQDLELDGKLDQRIEVKGQIYTQKSASRDLKESWDAHLGLGGTLRTLLLTPAT